MQFWLGAFAFYILGTGSDDGMKFFYHDCFEK